MKKVVASIILISTVVSAHAFDERGAEKLVKKYSETVACQIEENKYKAVKIKADDPDLGGLGEIYLVNWAGDVGCAGGNGTVIPQFTTIEHSGFESVPPVVTTSYKFPELDLVIVKSFTGKNGIVTIKGLTYGANDQQGYPRKAVSYNIKFDQSGFVKQ